MRSGRGAGARAAGVTMRPARAFSRKRIVSPFPEPRMTMRSFVLLSLLSLAGCAVATEPQHESNALRLVGGAGVVFRADRPAYSHGDTALVILRNDTDQRIGHNLCTSARERREGGGWVRIEPLRMCTAALYGLEPGEETTHPEPITGEWVPGEYRIVTTVEITETGERGEVFTGSFRVDR